MKTLRFATGLARQCLLVSTALFSVCWAVHAQNLTVLSSVDFDGSSSTYTTNFNFSEAGTPLAFWNSGIGVTNSDGVDPGTSGGTTGIHTNRTFDFATAGRQYVLTMWCKYSGTPPGTGSGRPLVELGLVNLTNASINTSSSSNATRNVCLAYWWNTWVSGVGDTYDLRAFTQTTTGANKDLCAYDKPIQLNYPTYKWMKLTAVLANIGDSRVRIDGWVDGYTDDLSSSLRYHTALPYVMTNADLCTNNAVYAGWRNRYNSGRVSALDLFAVAEPGTPAAPTGFVTALGDGTVSLTWNYSQYALGHNVYRAPAPTGPFTQIASIGITNGPNTFVTNANFTKFTDSSGLTLGDTYYYFVTATNLAGESVGSTTNSLLYSPPVQNVVALGGTNQVALTWNAITLLGGATNYTIARANVSGGPYTPVGSTTSTSYVDTGLQAGIRYFYIVQGAMSTGVPSGASAEAAAFTAAGSPANVLAEAFTANCLRFGWTTADLVPATTIIEASADGVTYSPVGLGTNCTATTGVHMFGNASHFYLTGLAADATRYFRAYATNASGFSPVSTVVVATTFPVPGIDVNFAPGDAVTYLDILPGYVSDWGESYGVRTNGYTYGWDMNKTGNAVTRGYYGNDDRYRTFNQMYSTNNWTVTVPNGVYLVHLSSGDPNSPVSAQYVVQGQDSGLVHPDGVFGNWWIDQWVTATATGGSLSISNGYAVSNNRLQYLNIYPTAPEANTIGTQPQTQNVIENAQAEFSVMVAGGPQPYGYQWYENNVAIPGANSRTYTIPAVALAQDGNSYYVAVTNAGASVNSSVAVLHVTARTAPVLLSAGSVDGTTIGVAFDEALDGSVQNPALFSVSGGPTITSVLLRPDQKTLVLSLDYPLTGNFSVTANNILDAVGHTLSTATVNSSVLGLTNQDIGPTYAGDTFTADNVNLEVTGGGGDIFNVADGCRFVYRTVDGDFDARVRVTSLTSESNPISKAVLMARETTDAGSVDIMIDVNAPYSQVDTSGNHGRDQYSSDVRSTTDGGTSTWGWYFRPAGIPDCWIRLVRLGNQFRAYRSLDGGTTWTQTGSNTLATTSTLLLGLAVTAHNASMLATATFQNFTVAPLAPDIAVLKNAAVSTAILGSTVQYTITANNQGSAGSASVVINDTLPAGMSYSTSWATSGSVSYNAGVLTWTIGAMAAGQNATLTVNATAQTVGTKVNLAVATASDDINPLNNSSSATVTVYQPAQPQLSAPTYNKATSTFAFSFPTELNVPYTIQYATNLVAPIAWQTLFTTTGNGLAQQVQDTTAANSPRFYRVTVIP